MKWALGVVLLAALTACGQEADIPAIESEITTWAEDNSPEGTDIEVDCPDTIEWRTGGDFHCIVSDQNGETVRVTVTMENDDGDVTWVVG